MIGYFFAFSLMIGYYGSPGIVYAIWLTVIWSDDGGALRAPADLYPGVYGLPWEDEEPTFPGTHGRGSGGPNAA